MRGFNNRPGQRSSRSCGRGRWIMVGVLLVVYVAIGVPAVFMWAGAQRGPVQASPTVTTGSDATVAEGDTGDDADGKVDHVPSVDEVRERVRDLSLRMQETLDTQVIDVDVRTLIRYEYEDEGSGNLTGLGRAEQALTDLVKQWTAEPASTPVAGTLDRLDECFDAWEDLVWRAAGDALVTKFAIYHNQIRAGLFPGGELPAGVDNACETYNADRGYPDLDRAGSGKDALRDAQAWVDGIDREYQACSAAVASDDVGGAER